MKFERLAKSLFFFHIDDKVYPIIIYCSFPVKCCNLIPFFDVVA